MYKSNNANWQIDGSNRRHVRQRRAARLAEELSDVPSTRRGRPNVLAHVPGRIDPGMKDPTKLRKRFLAVVGCALACAAPVRPVSADVRPRIRAVTAFIEIDRNNYASRIAEAQTVLAAGGMKTEDAVAFIGKLRDAAQQGPSGLNIGSAMLHETPGRAMAPSGLR